MNKSTLDSIVDCMLGDPSIQKIQTEHRLKLAQFWGIKEGHKVLEIGCGQGDTTAVLAHLVGENGSVHGIDIASPDYGAPATLGESADYLKQSKLGNRVKIDFEVDVLSSEIDFPEKAFDVIVISHCSWYFKSFEELTAVLKKTKRWGKQLCYAEWDAEIKKIEQYPHFLAIQIQVQYECFKETSLSNVRTFVTPSDIRRIAKNSGWTIVNEESVYSPELQDGGWEIDHTLSEYPIALEEIDRLPIKLKSLLKSQVSLLEASLKYNDVKPLSTYAFIAE